VHNGSGQHLGTDPVGANLVFALVFGASYASTESKTGEYQIRPYGNNL